MEINNIDDSKNKFPATNVSHSLPLMTDLLALESGMDVLPRTPAHGPYHHNNLVHHHHNYHHHTDQTKSLQELQNEVGALLEFRDLVIETFPDLKHKMASSSANSTITGLQSSSIISRREWEPGIRVRRKLNSNYSKEGSGEIQSSSLLIRSRSNSHSGKKEPKSGEGNGSVIQDSGFSTETSSSKEAHSASSTAGSAGVQGNNISSALTARLTSNPTSSNSDNELWNLLDVIHRRTSRLADESNQKFNNNNNNHSNTGQSSTAVNSSSSFQSQLNYMKKDDVQKLRNERDHLMDKMGDMEAEVLASLIKESKLQDQINELRQTKAELETQLKFALGQKSELSRLRDINLLFDDSPNSQNDNKLNRPKTEDIQSNVVVSPIVKNRTSSSSSSSSSTTTFQPIPIKPQITNKEIQKSSINDDHLTLSTSSSCVVKQMKDELNAIGRLDGLISNPNSKLNKIRVPDSKKIAAILLETNIIELQRHLLTITVQNQVLQQKLEQATKSKILLIKKLDKSKEDVEDLKFTVEERNIELEGARAQIRVMEAKLLAARCDVSPEHQSSSSSTTTRLSRDGITVMHTSTPIQRHIQPTTISTPSMKAMIPLAMDDLFQHSSSTESAHDQQERDMTTSKCPETPRRTKPSKIPLPGSTKTAVNFSTKPPSGRAISAGPPSANRSLTKSTSSLYAASGFRAGGPSSLTKKDLSLNRPDSVHSLRNSNSMDGNKTQQQANRNSSSSIPISQSNSTNVSNKLVATASPTLIAAYGNATIVNIPSSSPNKFVTSSQSPVLRPKRDSLTTRVKNLDSLSRLQSSSSSGTLSANGIGGNAISTPRLNNNSNCNNNQNVVTNGTNNNNNNRKYTALPVRRMSNVSVRDANTIDHQHHIHHHNDNSSSANGNSDANSGKVHYLNLKYNNDIGQNNNKHVQSNVMEKSSTTLSINSALELEVENARKKFEAPIQLRSRDLICEYLQKSIIKVPDILKPQQNHNKHQQHHCHNETFSASVDVDINDIDLAYKHPMVIAEELEHGGREALAFDSLKKINHLADNSSIIIPQYKQEVWKNPERPHLIGKVTPNIARTWKQLSSTMNHFSEYEKQEEEDKQSYVLFVRKPFNFSASDSHENVFAVNKIHHLAESEKFYDSIEEYNDDYEEEIDDIDYNLDYEDGNMTCGGEMMADETDSLEMRRCGKDDVIVWSIES
ncbi:hypothetical protein ACKWTF_013932 [Chironomus riparius]